VRPLENAYARAQAREPDRYRLSPSTAFLVEPREWLAVCREADGAGEEVACLFHSHVEAGAWLSPEDRAWAAPAGEPLLPGVSYLVVALRGGRAQEARVFWWQAGAFACRPVALSP
jgi:proteasome lid subunit RPN8/RPN11